MLQLCLAYPLLTDDGRLQITCVEDYEVSIDAKEVRTERIWVKVTKTLASLRRAIFVMRLHNDALQYCSSREKPHHTSFKGGCHLSTTLQSEVLAF